MKTIESVDANDQSNGAGRGGHQQDGRFANFGDELFCKCALYVGELYFDRTHLLSILRSLEMISHFRL